MALSRVELEIIALLFDLFISLAYIIFNKKTYISAF